MAKSALARQESRGSHYRSDFPYRDDDDFAKHSIVRKGQDVRFAAWRYTYFVCSCFTDSKNTCPTMPRFFALILSMVSCGVCQ